MEPVSFNYTELSAMIKLSSIDPTMHDLLTSAKAHYLLVGAPKPNALVKQGATGELKDAQQHNRDIMKMRFNL